MNTYLIPAEYQLSEDFERPSEFHRGPTRRWTATTVVVAVIFGATLVLVCGAEVAAATQ